MTFGKVELTGPAAILLALLFYLDDSGTAAWAALACLIHELGHWGAVWALGSGVKKLRLSCAGASLTLAGPPLPPGRLALAAAAGPAANLLLAWVSANLARFGRGSGLYLLAGISLGLGLFNLIPAGWLDGGVILDCLFSVLGLDRVGRALLLVTSAALTALLLAAGLFLLWGSGGRSFTLLLAALWTARAARREGAGGEFR